MTSKGPFLDPSHLLHTRTVALMLYSRRTPSSSTMPPPTGQLAPEIKVRQLHDTVDRMQVKLVECFSVMTHTTNLSHGILSSPRWWRESQGNQKLSERPWGQARHRHLQPHTAEDICIVRTWNAPWSASYHGNYWKDVATNSIPLVMADCVPKTSQLP